MCEKCYALTGAKWGAADAGTGGGVVTWSLARTVGKWFGFDWHFGDIGPYAGLIRKAFGAWESVADIDFREVADGAGADIRLGRASIDGSHGTIGRASWSYTNTRGGEFAQMKAAEIVFDGGETWNLDGSLGRYEVDFYATAVHEIGHAIGLGHTSGSDSIMYQTQQRGTLSLTQNDVTGIQAIYGPSVGGARVEAAPQPQALAGTLGDDILHLAPHLFHINALGGHDTVTVPGASAAYRHELTGDDRVVLTNKATGEIDYLDNVERIRFTDGTLATDIDGEVAQAYRLYQAAFDRTPDTPGLSHWTRLLDDDHLTLHQAAGHFIGSEEFRITYGPSETLSTDDFVTLLYLNVLDREPEAAGRANWNHQADIGMTRSEMLVGFSESTENKANVQPDIQDGIWLV